MGPAGRARGFGRDLFLASLDLRYRGRPRTDPALVVDAFRVPGRSPRQTALRFLRPRERARCRSHVYVPLGKADQEPPARRQTFSPHVEADRPLVVRENHTAIASGVKQAGSARDFRPPVLAYSPMTA